MMQWIGRELRRRYADALRRPMNWRMIDAFVRLHEADEERTRAKPAPKTGDEGGSNVIFIRSSGSEKD